MRGSWARRAAATLAAIGVAATLTVVGTSTATATQGYCGISWGSLPKSASSTEPYPLYNALTNVRGGRHQCWDRLVLDIRAGGADEFRVQYVSQVTMDGSGNVVPLRGGAKLEIIAVAPAYDDAGNPTYRPANQRELVNVAGWDTFRQVAWAGSFEGQTTIGLGVRARLPFRAFVLDGPGDGSRIVIDVAHRWS